MSRVRDFLASRAEWRQYWAQLREMEREVGRLAPAEGQAPSAEYTEAGIRSEVEHDRCRDRL